MHIFPYPSGKFYGEIYLNLWLIRSERKWLSVQISLTPQSGIRSRPATKGS